MKALYMPMTEQYYILALVKGRCHGNQLKSKNWPISFVALPFRNTLQYNNSDLKIVNSMLDETAKIGISDGIYQ